MAKRKPVAKVPLAAADSIPFNTPFGQLAGVRPTPAKAPPAAVTTAPGAQQQPLATLALQSAVRKPPANPGQRQPADAPQPVIVRHERKGRGGKTVTLVSGLPLGAEALIDLAKVMRKKMGCGITVEGSILVLQGDQRQRCVTVLTAEGIQRVRLGT